MNIKQLCEEFNNGKKLNYVFFWSGNDKLSNWYPIDFVVDGVSYWCTEQYMMAKKAEVFGDKVVQAEVMLNRSQKEIKALGRKVRNFDSDVWDKHREQVVYEGNLAKFSQNEELKSYMLSTGDSILVEASPFDKIWGIGMSKDDYGVDNPNNWKGQNLLGFTLMKVRENLKNK